MGTESPLPKSSIFCPFDQVPKLSVIPEHSRIHSRLQTVYAAPIPPITKEEIIFFLACQVSSCLGFQLCLLDCQGLPN